MQFKVFPLIASALFGATVGAELTADQVVNGINEIASISNDADMVAKDINPVKIYQYTPQLVGGFKMIVQKATMLIPITEEKPSTPFAKSDQLEICSTFKNFVKIHQALLATIIGKSGVLSSSPFVDPIAAVLRQVENGVDTLAENVMMLVPSCSNGTMSDLEALDRALDRAVMAYM